MAKTGVVSLGWELASLLIGVGIACTAYLCAMATTQVRVRRTRRPRSAVPPPVSRTLSLLGFAIAVAPSQTPGAIGSLDPFSPPAHRPPWSRAGGSLPPRPLVREGAIRPSVHPAIHARREPRPHDRLFPRVGTPCRTHTVIRGDTLWAIAARALATEDPRRIARYWPKIHRANRATIGSDPNLIRPGQVLRLPDECDA